MCLCGRSTCYHSRPCFCSHSPHSSCPYSLVYVHGFGVCPSPLSTLPVTSPVPEPVFACFTWDYYSFECEERYVTKSHVMVNVKFILDVSNAVKSNCIFSSTHIAFETHTELFSFHSTQIISRICSAFFCCFCFSAYTALLCEAKQADKTGKEGNREGEKQTD